jgi:hypothetical protein
MGGVLVSLVVAMALHASGACPTAADVDRQLVPLLGTGAATPLSDVATITHGDDGSLLVSLDDADGHSIGTRRFPRAGSCRDQVETVAVTLAIWEAQIHPEISLRLDRLSSQAPPPSAPTDVTTLRRAPEAASAQNEWSLGAGVAGDWQPGTSGAWAPAGRVELGVGRAGGRLRGRLAVVGVGLGAGSHTLDVAPGQATWWRAFASLGVDYDVVRGRHFASALGVGALGGVASISGKGFAVNQTSRSVDAGGEARARAEWRAGRVRPWLSVSFAVWARRQELDLQGQQPGRQGGVTLGRLEPMAALGADFVW